MTTRNSATHIVIASDRDRDTLIDAAVEGADITWLVPKMSTAGDRILLFHRGEGILGRATLSSAPKETELLGRYRATATGLKLFRNPITLEKIRGQFPTWGWPTYPRGYTTVPVDMLFELDPLLEAAE